MTKKTRSNVRPLPADFAEIRAKLVNDYAVMRHYKVGQRAFARWKAEAGVVSTYNDDAPSDVAAVSATRSVLAVSKHYGISQRKARRWMIDAGVDMNRPRPKPMGVASPRGVPEDFAEVAPTMTRSELKERYNTSYKYIRMWLAASGVDARPRDYTAEIKRIDKMVRERAPSPSAHAKAKLQDMRKRDMYDEAADVLRRERFKVNVCDENGRFQMYGDYWRIGLSVITPDELLQRAAKYTQKMEIAA